MLVITRRPGESFFIGDEIEVCILEGGPVRIGISAPREISVVRTELLEPDEIETVEN
jgi:carbon storage regulator